MPAATAPRQPDQRLADWFRGRIGRALLEAAQRDCAPELTRVFGSSGLYLRPIAELPAELSGNMLARVLSLHREGGQFAGQFRCTDGELPVASTSLALAYLLFVLESGDRPLALVEEVARCLRPEGTALVLCLNPLSPSRVRWWGRGVRPVTSTALERLAQDAGLDVVRHQPLGPIWLRPAWSASSADDAPAWLGWLCAGRMTVLRRRELPLTPVRRPGTAKIHPGTSTGLAAP